MRTPLALSSILPLALAASTLLAAPAARAADRVVLLPATGANVPEAELAAATDLLRADLEQTGRFAVELGATPGGSIAEPSPADAGAEARAQRATLAVTLRISRLGSAASARLAAYHPDGTLFHADALTAENPDDLEPVLKRLAQGLASARPAADLADVDTVTEREARPPRKIASTHVWGFRVGTSWLIDRPGTGGAHELTGVGMFWLFDVRHFLAEVAGDYQAGGGDHVLDGSLGVYLPLARGDVAPYLGGGVGWMLVGTQRKGEGGLEARAAGGVLFGRLHSLQVRVEGGYRSSLFRMRVGERGRPLQGPFLSAGLGW